MIEFAITTATDAAAIGGDLASWAKTLRERLLDPVVQDMHGVAADGALSFPTPKPAACHVTFSVELADSLRVANYNYTNSNWNRILTGLSESKWRTVNVNAWFVDASSQPVEPRARVTFAIDLKGLEWPDASHLIAFSLSEDLAEARLRGEGQKAFVDLVKSGVIGLKATSGYVTRGESLLHKTTYEDSIGVAVGVGQDFASDWLRGAFWGNYLTQEHLRKLGGKRTVLQKAPCQIADELNADDGELVYLQATRDLWDECTTQLGELERFLRPSLITKDVTLPKTAPPPADVIAAADPRTGNPQGWLRVAHSLDPSTAEFALTIGGALSEEQKAILEEILDAWARIGLMGGFGGYLHAVSGRDVAHEETRTIVKWSMDLGTAGVASVDVLVRCLEELSRRAGFRIEALQVR